MNFFSKTIIFLIIFLLIFNSSGVFKPGFLRFAPPVAEAGIWSQLATDIAQFAVDVVVWAADWVEKNWQILMRDVIAKRIIDYIVDQTVLWIQGGGEPKFIGNWEGFLKDAGDIAFDSVIREVGLAGLCQPFGLQVKMAFLPAERFSKSISCTLDKVVKNIENFYVDFSVGGWEGYMVSWEPQNNFYGVMLLSHDEAIKRVAKAKLAAQAEGQAGKGFLGVKKCKGGGAKYTEGDENQGGFNKDEHDEFYRDKGYIKDTTGNYCPQDELRNTTPGALVGDAIGSAITSDKDWAANIQSWVSALVNAVINRFIDKGLSEMSDSSDSDYSSSSYYPQEYQDLKDSQSQQDKQTIMNEINKFTSGWQNLLTPKQQSLDYASSTLAMLTQINLLGCLVAADEISAAQASVSDLQAEIIDLNNKIEEANALIADIEAADISNTGQWAEIKGRYQVFISVYNNTETQQQISSNSIQAAWDESSQKAIENDAVKARFDTCSGAPVAIVINSGATTTISQNVVLNFNASLSGLTATTTQIMVSNNSAFSGAVWEIYATTKSWTLTAGTGLKTVYAKFRDSLGNVSNVFSDDIVLQ